MNWDVYSCPFCGADAPMGVMSLVARCVGCGASNTQISKRGEPISWVLPDPPASGVDPKGNADMLASSAPLANDVERQKVVDLFAATKGPLYYSDISQRLNLDLERTVAICNDLERDGVIGEQPLASSDGLPTDASPFQGGRD
jgi:hypothetical protein